jgi:hypothetical protein
MPRAPLTFNTITCQNCGGIIALIPSGALVVITRLRCIHCHVDRTLKPVDSSERGLSTAATVAPA